jgi:poly(3-hydroxybutyrate) depolymerase
MLRWRTQKMRRRLTLVATMGLVASLAACADGQANTTPPTTGGTVADQVVCGQSLGAGRSAVACEGLSFDVSLPDTCPAGSCGLIVDLPGGVGSGKDAERSTGMQELGNAAGFVVVQPDTPSGGWNYSVDSGRIRSFLDQLIEAFELDQGRVHIGGHSAGGYMAWALVCDQADLIASAAPLGAGASTEDHPSCDFDTPGQPSEEVDILLSHGRRDEIVPFSTAVAQRDLVVTAWAMAEREVLADEPTYRWTRWVSPTGTVLEFLEFDWSGGELGGHCYPGVAGEVGCGADTPVHYGKAALDFYLAHPKDE